MTGRSSKTDVDIGYAVGGGIEHAIAPKWTLKAEYQYINLGTTDVSTPIFFAGALIGLDQRTKVEADLHTVRFGINYKFGSEGYEPLK